MSAARSIGSLALNDSTDVPAQQTWKGPTAACSACPFEDFGLSAAISAQQPPIPRSGALQNRRRMADGVGFEPTRPSRACRFSRPVPSTARPPIHVNKQYVRKFFSCYFLIKCPPFDRVTLHPQALDAHRRPDTVTVRAPCRRSPIGRTPSGRHLRLVLARHPRTWFVFWAANEPGTTSGAGHVRNRGKPDHHQEIPQPAPL